jgi:hypothetical protein
MRRLSPLVACLVAMGILVLWLCGHSGWSTASFCLVDTHREYKFGGKIRLHVWDLKAAGLNELTVRLLIIQNGKAQTAHQTVCQWKGWNPPSPPANGRLMLLIEDPQPSETGKRFPHLGLDLQVPAATQAHTASNETSVAIDGKLQLRMSASSSGDSVGTAVVIYSEVYALAKDTNPGSLDGSLDSLIASSKAAPGGTLLAVTVEAKPQR